MKSVYCCTFTLQSKAEYDPLGHHPQQFPGAIQKQLQSLHPISQMGNQNITSKLYSLLYNVTYIR